MFQGIGYYGTTLNIDTLNLKLKEAIDFVYTLYHSVSNLVGMATMVENTIVYLLFCNKVVICSV